MLATSPENNVVGSVSDHLPSGGLIGLDVCIDIDFEDTRIVSTNKNVNKPRDAASNKVMNEQAYCVKLKYNRSANNAIDSNNSNYNTSTCSDISDSSQCLEARTARKSWHELCYQSPQEMPFYNSLNTYSTYINNTQRVCDVQNNTSDNSSFEINHRTSSTTESSSTSNSVLCPIQTPNDPTLCNYNQDALLDIVGDGIYDRSVETNDDVPSQIEISNSYDRNISEISSEDTTTNENIGNDVMSKMISWNIQGLRQKLQSSTFVSFLGNYHVIALSEINNCPKKCIEEAFPNYSVFISYRETYNGGGLAVLFHNKFVNDVKLIQSDIDECLSFLINEKATTFNSDVIMCFLYVAHEHSVVYTNSLYNGIERFANFYLKMTNKYGELPWLIGGDLNARTGQLNDIPVDCNPGHFIGGFEDCLDLTDNDNSHIHNRKSLDNETNLFGRLLVEFCKINKLCILNGRTKSDSTGKITCIANGGRSVVDYVLCHLQLYDLIDDLEIIPRCESDHFPLVVKLQEGRVMDTTSVEDTECDINSGVKQTWLQNSNHIEKYTFELNELLLKRNTEFVECLEKHQVDEAVNIINSCIITANDKLNQATARRYSNKQKQPSWFDAECVELKRKKYQLLNKFHASNSPETLRSFINCRNKFRTLCRNKKRIFLNVKSLELLNNACRPNSKNFWSVVKTLTTKSKSVADTIKPCDWYQYFKNLLNPIVADEEAGNTEWENLIHPNNSSQTTLINDEIDIVSQDILNSDITTSEVVNAIKALKSGKAHGPDGIGPDFYKIFCPIYVTYLTQLFNTIFHSGKYPLEWSKSMIFPLFKKGYKNDVNNYRGISLLNVCGKMFSFILNKRLQCWCEHKNLLPEEQAGFRSSYSTIDNIFTLQCLIQKSLSKSRGRFYVYFIDFFKAFDWVNRSLLWEIMKESGCKGSMLASLKAMYSNVMVCVKILNPQAFEYCNRYNNDMNNHTQNDVNIANSNSFSFTQYFEAMSGVRQGCILSPLLFSLFINMFVSEINNSGIDGVQVLTNDTEIHCLLYADDLSIFAETVVNLQRKIGILEYFCTKWQLKVNHAKSKIIVFRNGGILRQTEQWWYRNEKIDTVTYYSYLGMVFSSRLCWSTCLDNYVCKAARIVSNLRRVFNDLQYIDTKTACRIFDMKVKPILLYGSEIWGANFHEEIEQVQIKFCKAYLGLGKTTSNVKVLRELNRHSLSVDYNYRAIKYWCKLLFTGNDRLIRKSYVQQYTHCESKRVNWASNIKHLLESIGFGYAWHAQEIGDVNFFLNQVKQRLLDIDYQKINDFVDLSIDSSRTLSSLSIPQYLQFQVHISCRRIFTLLRTNSLPLSNNLTRINLASDNVCIRCPMHVIDDEKHFLFECPFFNDIRHKYNFLVCGTKTEDEKLQDVMLCTNKYLFNQIISYIKDTNVLKPEHNNM